MVFDGKRARDAPPPNVSDYYVSATLIRDVWVGGLTDRLRRFSYGRAGSGGGCGFPPLEIECLALFRSDTHPAVCSDARVQPVALGGKRKKIPGVARTGPAYGPRLSTREMAQRQGAPPDLFGDSPFTESAKRKMLGNGVPLPMGRAVAKAVKRAMGYTMPDWSEPARQQEHEDAGTTNAVARAEGDGKG